VGTQDLLENVEPPGWVLTQKKTFTRWINAHLKKKDQEIDDVATGLTDGLKLMTLIHVLYNVPIPRYNKNPRMKAAIVRFPRAHPLPLDSPAVPPHARRFGSWTM
jgi:hypothetical protein